MDDDRIWEFERVLWLGDADHYRDLIDQHCVMVLPSHPYVLSGADAIEAVAHSPRWGDVAFSDGQVMRPQEGLIVIAYHAAASGGAKTAGYEAYCSTTIRRLEHEVWRVVQHQQTPPPLV